MKITLNRHSIFESDSQTIIVLFDVNAGISGFVGDLDDHCDDFFSKLSNEMLPKKNGQLRIYHQLPNLLAKSVLLVGIGNNITQFVKSTSQITPFLKEHGMSNVSTSVALSSFDFADAFELTTLLVQSVVESNYVCDDYKSEKITKTDITLGVVSQDESIANAIHKGESIAKGMNTLKHLGNAPGNVCTPTYLASYAKKMSDDLGNITTTIFEQDALETMKMGALLSVSKGSIEPPKLVKMEYNGGKGDPIVLVGKGVTFDTGGISLKPAASMDEMKYDMCGAGSVVGALHAIALLKLPINVVGLIPTVENMPSDRATKPGDIVTSMSGKTIEVLNTDAEGRMILCDAITYAKQLKPKAVIDIATLTGAVIVALGRAASGVMSNDDELAKQLEKAGNGSLDRVWRLPIWDDYTKLLESPFADLQNIGGREAGAITAGCFLAEFAKDVPWAHIDIAGTAWTNRKVGATGRPVPLLVEYLASQVEDK